jgi:3-phosphoshikimate 1-carboxyvinyltransferase
MRSLVVVGALDVPGDKSISHRALIFAALGTGRSEIHGVLASADTLATARVLGALGRPVPPLAPVMHVEGRGLAPRRPPGEALADCANSGTTARLMAGVAAAQDTVSRFDGDASLRGRPMSRIASPLAEMGAGIHWRGPEPDRLPMEVRGGGLRSLRFATEVPSAQVKSGLLLAGLCARVPVSIRESLPTRDHTERLLWSLGVELSLREGWLEFQPPLALPAARYDVPGDPSSAAFFVALATGAGRGSLTLRRVLLNPRRVGFLRVLERMGGVFDVHEEVTAGGEPVGNLVVHASALRGTTVEAAEVPDLIDEVPVLSVLAAVADGETRVHGAAELRVKESDRLRAIVENLTRCGIDAEELPDGLVVRGGGPVRPARITTHGDHRIAMAFAILSAVSGVALELDVPGCVDVSYPTFWSDLARVTAAP